MICSAVGAALLRTAWGQHGSMYECHRLNHTAGSHTVQPHTHEVPRQKSAAKCCTQLSDLPAANIKHEGPSSCKQDTSTSRTAAGYQHRQPRKTKPSARAWHCTRNRALLHMLNHEPHLRTLDERNAVPAVWQIGRSIVLQVSVVCSQSTEVCRFAEIRHLDTSCAARCVGTTSRNC